MAPYKYSSFPFRAYELNMTVESSPKIMWFQQFSELGRISHGKSDTTKIFAVITTIICYCRLTVISTLHCVHAVNKMWSILTDVTRSVVYVSVCVSVTLMCRAKTWRSRGCLRWVQV